MPRRQRLARRDLCRHASYRHNLVGDQRQAADHRAVPASRTADFQRAEMDADRLARLDSADRRQRHARPVLRRCPPHQRASTPARTSTSRRSQNGFTVVNGRVGIHGPDDSWGVEVWAQNLFDKKYKQVAFDAPLQGSGTPARRRSAASIPRVDAAVRRVPRRAADLRRDLARQARLRPRRRRRLTPPRRRRRRRRCRPAADGSVIAADAACPAPPPPPPPPPTGARPSSRRLERGWAFRQPRLRSRSRARREQGRAQARRRRSASSFLPSARVR